MWRSGQPNPGNFNLVTNPGDVASKPVTTYSISGTVSGDTKIGITLSLSGAVSMTAITDGSGNYSLQD
jgi:hypothetical protein